MARIKISQFDKIKEVEAEEGKNLLQIIRDNGFELFAPCGGNGTCGKCSVHIKGEGYVTSCLYYPETDIEVLLPDRRESQILTTQYEYSTKVTPYPGDAVMKASWPLGVALDIGTSTMAFYLVNLITGSVEQSKGVVNPQTKFGADVISRIQHCSTEEGLKELQSELIRVINEELIACAKKSYVESDQIVKITIAGNTTMLHILLGVDPTSIALAPFTPTFTEAKILKAPELGFAANQEAEIHILPSLSAYGGAGIIAGLASISPPESIQNYIFLDIGTNGEMALRTPEKIQCCATAAGPAFEGANISCGMGAFAGALASYSADKTFTTIANEPVAGICGSGLIDIVSYMVKNKLVAEDGLLKEDFVIVGDVNSNRTITITQQDIREVQLAKAAIMAGINIMIKTAGLEMSQIDALFLAGGFGNYINTESAIAIGLLPEALKDKIIPIGNTSGTGATLALKSQMFQKTIDQILEKAEYIELSSHEDFVVEYAMSMELRRG
ncbi:MAG: ASKHA domain-containing protein [Bacteroidales bacterium]|nr:ASKHA domain-containing protein [Bacteroidales bacterium]